MKLVGASKLSLDYGGNTILDEVDLSRDAVEDTLTGIRERGGLGYAAACEVTDRDSVNDAFAEGTRSR